MKNLKRFNENWLGKAKDFVFGKEDKGEDDDMAEKVIDYIEDCKKNAQTLTLDITGPVHYKYKKEFLFKVNGLDVEISKDDDFTDMRINKKELNVSFKLKSKIYNIINDIYTRNKRREENEEKDEIRRKY